MPHMRGKNKGKTGKIEQIEEYLGTEELSGTYEGRKHNWKIINAEKLVKAKMEADAVAAYRKKREGEIRKVLVDTGYVEEVNRKIGLLLTWVMNPDAYRYLCMIMATEPLVCQEMMKHLILPMDIKRLDEYLDAIRTRGHGPIKRITLDTVIKLERQVKKIKAKIMVERDGRRRELGSD